MPKMIITFLLWRGQFHITRSHPHLVRIFHLKRNKIKNAYYWREITTTVEFFNCFFECERGDDFEFGVLKMSTPNAEL
jgi:hypothetical protein